MRVVHKISAAILICGIAAAGCGKRQPGILAKVNDQVITVSQFENRISKLPAHYQDAVSKNKKVFLDELITDMILYEEAKKKKLDRDEEVAEIIEEAKRKIMIARLLQDEISDKIEITDEEIEVFYEANKAKFMDPEILRASHILVKTEDEAKRIKQELARSADFAELAKKYSIDPTAKIGGDVGEFKGGDLVPVFEEACFELDVGQVSDIVKTKFGYHVIKLTERKGPELKSLEEIKDGIRGILRQRKRKEVFNKLVRKLREKAKIEINERLLEKEEE